ncbi:hypothetical protein NKG94_47010 [Micromonospora sp. M12]
MSHRELYCDVCEGVAPFEAPPCVDDHGTDCPELVCIDCGSAVVIARSPSRSPGWQIADATSPPTVTRPEPRPDPSPHRQAPQRPARPGPAPAKPRSASANPGLARHRPARRSPTHAQSNPSAARTAAPGHDEDPSLWGTGLRGGRVGRERDRGDQCSAVRRVPL